jgi:hypothetical protein
MEPVGKIPTPKTRREIVKSLRDDQKLSFAQIGEALGISRQRAQQLYVEPVRGLPNGGNPRVMRRSLEKKRDRLALLERQGRRPEEQIELRGEITRLEEALTDVV